MHILFNKKLIIFVVCCVISNPIHAKHESGHDLSDEEWETIKNNVELIDKLNYMPTLLPTIMKNRDVLQLTEEQIRSFRSWRKQYYGYMVRVMNELIEKRIEFKKAALDLDTTSEYLHLLQNNIFKQQKELLEIKLSCRQMLVDTFTDDQWDNFAFVLSEHPKLASFIQH